MKKKMKAPRIAAPPTPPTTPPTMAPVLLLFSPLLLSVLLFALVSDVKLVVRDVLLDADIEGVDALGEDVPSELVLVTGFVEYIVSPVVVVAQPQIPSDVEEIKSV
jgi:hypothetical protein